MPPKAAIIGNVAFFKLESSPMYISRSNSKPINRKKMEKLFQKKKNSKKKKKNQ